MSDRRPADYAASSEGEALSAYLRGDLGDAAAEALEARLLTDPTLAEQLERMRELLESLQAVDDVTPPEGYSERLRARLQAAQAADRPAAEQPALAADEERAVVRSISSAPSRRRVPWGAISAAAAGLIALAVVAPTVLSSFGGGDAGMTAAEEAPEAAEGGADLFAVETEAPAAEADRAEMAAGDEAIDEAAEPAEEEAEETVDAQTLPRQPMLVDEGVELADDAELSEHFSNRPETEALLGTPLSEADDYAAAYRAFAQREETFSSGVAPTECLDPLVADADNPLVLARAESLTYQGAPALAYLLVGASAGAEHLDRVELWVTDPESCRTRTFLDLTP